MLNDIYTVLWKEARELVLQQGSPWRWAGMQALNLAVLGGFLPWQFGRAWVESPAMMALWLWMPLLNTVNVAADSFAGERERHTLETLLASRLPDRAIVLGKVLVAVGYGWATALGAALVGLVSVNLFHGNGEWVMYRPEVWVGLALLTPLASGLVATLGALVSLRASTVRHAFQVLGVGMLVLTMGPVLAMRYLPPVTVDPRQAVLVVCVGLVAVLALALAAAFNRFRRTRIPL